jgi:hypothetical protein
MPSPETEILPSFILERVKARAEKHLIPLEDWADRDCLARRIVAVKGALLDCLDDMKRTRDDVAVGKAPGDYINDMMFAVYRASYILEFGLSGPDPDIDSIPYDHDIETDHAQRAALLFAELERSSNSRLWQIGKMPADPTTRIRLAQFHFLCAALGMTVNAVLDGIKNSHRTADEDPEDYKDEINSTREHIRQLKAKLATLYGRRRPVLKEFERLKEVLHQRERELNDGRPRNQWKRLYDPKVEAFRDRVAQFEKKIYGLKVEKRSQEKIFDQYQVSSVKDLRTLTNFLARGRNKPGKLQALRDHFIGLLDDDNLWLTQYIDSFFHSPSLQWARTNASQSSKSKKESSPEES